MYGRAEHNPCHPPCLEKHGGRRSTARSVHPKPLTAAARRPLAGCRPRNCFGSRCRNYAAIATVPHRLTYSLAAVTIKSTISDTGHPADADGLKRLDRRPAFSVSSLRMRQSAPTAGRLSTTSFSAAMPAGEDKCCRQNRSSAQPVVLDTTFDELHRCPLILYRFWFSRPLSLASGTLYPRRFRNALSSNFPEKTNNPNRQLRRFGSKLYRLVPEAGVEPARYRYHRILSPAASANSIIPAVRIYAAPSVARPIYPDIISQTAIICKAFLKINLRPAKTALALTKYKRKCCLSARGYGNLTIVKTGGAASENTAPFGA